MSHIEINKKHTLGKRGARTTAEKLAEKMASEYGAKYTWKGDDLTFTSSGVKGNLHVGEDNVEIRVNLGMLLRPLKSKIQSGIMAQLDDIMGDDSSVA